MQPSAKSARPCARCMALTRRRRSRETIAEAVWKPKMQFTNAEEFWNALARLYDSTLELRAHIERLDEKTERLAEGTERLAAGTERLLHVSEGQQRSLEALQSVAESHERRLDRTEITVEAILEDLRRSRGQQS